MLLVDKPAGMTSHEAVLAVRARAAIRRIGHTGTLDPFATGLLLLLAGSFTRATEYFHALAKRYTAVMRLGVETDTEDRTGTPTAESDAWRGVSERDVRRAFVERRGESAQVPPLYSAKRVGGRRAHEEARRGGAVELAPAPVTIHALDVERFEPPLVAFSATVSTGTYVRSLARDIGRDLGCGAHLTELRRTRIGPFSVELAVPPSAAGRPGSPGGTGWRTPEQALAWLPSRGLDESEGELIRHGRPIATGTLRPPRDDPGPLSPNGSSVVSLVRDGALVAIAERVGDVLHPRKVFAG